MKAIALARSSTGGLVVPGLLLSGLAAIILGQLGVVHLPARTEVADITLAPVVVTVPAHDFTFRRSGDFLRDGHPVDGPLLAINDHPALDIMKFEVGNADYARCVTAGACKAAQPRRRPKGDVPVTGVSFQDADAYAAWLSTATGQAWRLPSMDEWAFAAGSREVDHALDAGSDAANPSQRWLLSYESETAGAGGPAAPSPLGTFGLNEFGVADLGGTVWEWTSTCASRTTLGPQASTVSHIDSCRIHYLEGRHRAPINDFMRDASGGGCGGGKPPDNLGFRLVRERR